MHTVRFNVFSNASQIKNYRSYYVECCDQIRVWFQQRNLVQSDHRLLYEGVFELYEFDSSKRARDFELWVCLMGGDLLSEPDDYGT